MKKWIVLVGLTAVIALALGVGLFWPQKLQSDQAALVELGIDKLTCGSCVENVREALADLPGLGLIEVNVTRGSGRVEFDPQQVDAEIIARRISAAGYPSRVAARLSVSEYAALRNRHQDLAGKYVAQIGNRFLSRAEFETTLALRSKTIAGKEQTAGPALQQAVWQDLLQRELLLNAAEIQKVVVQDGEVDLRLNSIRKSHPDFAKLVTERFGTLENLRHQVKNEMIIEKNLRENILPTGLNADEKSVFFERWYSTLVDATPVTIFDPSLAMDATRRASGCGGSCCNQKS
ncbi:hypothetical protein JCM30471_07240 [Desulfuromonas carbonis]